jgi:hypothetical protein
MVFENNSNLAPMYKALSQGAMRPKKERQTDLGLQSAIYWGTYWWKYGPRWLQDQVGLHNLDQKEYTHWLGQK